MILSKSEIREYFSNVIQDNFYNKIVVSAQYNDFDEFQKELINLEEKETFEIDEIIDPKKLPIFFISKHRTEWISISNSEKSLSSSDLSSESENEQIKVKSF